MKLFKDGFFFNRCSLCILSAENKNWLILKVIGLRLKKRVYDVAVLKLASEMEFLKNGRV